MSDIAPPNFEKKSFWQRPEGIVGAIVMAALLGGAGYLLFLALPALIAGTLSLIKMIALFGVLAVMIYVALDPKMRNLIWYMYKSVMRSVTGMFVKIDPIGILKSYVDDLRDNIDKLRKQIGILNGQKRKIGDLINQNDAEIDKNLKLAKAAKERNIDDQFKLKTRKAARLKDANEKYKNLFNRIEVLNRILKKMEKNSEILLEDTVDHVKLKEQERKVIRTSHSAMKSAMSVISGDPDKRAMFDQALEHIADDVAMKVGEMERFMEMSSSVMDSIDLQNGVFQEEGMQMLEQWEKQSTLLLLDPNAASNETLDLNSRPASPEKQARSGEGSSYDNFFN